MEYNARTQKGLLWTWVLILTGPLAFRFFIGDLVFDLLFYLRILFALFLLLSFFIRFRFVIDDGYLTFQTLFFSNPIYKKVLLPNQINEIKFIRFGWTKYAVIKVKKGLNVRIANFTPSNVFNDLIEFADEEGIPIFKTKDYLRLEK